MPNAILANNGAGLFLFRSVAPHISYRQRLSATGGAELYQLCGERILHRNQSCGAHQIGLLDAVQAHLRSIVGIAEEVEDEFEVVWSLWQYLPHYQAVQDLRCSQLREDDLDMIVDDFFKLVHVSQHRRVSKLEPVLEGGHLTLFVSGTPRRVLRLEDHQPRMHATITCGNLDSRPGAQNIESTEERMQQRRVIGIADILVVKLPIGL